MIDPLSAGIGVATHLGPLVIPKLSAFQQLVAEAIETKIIKEVADCLNLWSEKKDLSPLEKGPPKLEALSCENLYNEYQKNLELYGLLLRATGHSSPEVSSIENAIIVLLQRNIAIKQYCEERFSETALAKRRRVAEGFKLPIRRAELKRISKDEKYFNKLRTLPTITPPPHPPMVREFGAKKKPPSSSEDGGSNKPHP